jgi:hypothetical protein
LWQALQVPEKIWEGLLPRSRFSCARTPTAVMQPIRIVTVAIMSARLNIPCFSRYGIAFVPRSAVGGGHLLTDYDANGSTLIAHLYDRHT